MRKRLIIAGSSITLLFLASVFFLPPRQPSYHGIKLRDWLDVLFPASGSSPAQKQLAETAVREIGQDGLPWLIGWLRAKDGRLGESLAQSMYASLLPVGISGLWKPAVDHNAKAVEAFKVLGKTAEPAIPQLLDLATNSTDQIHPMFAIEALCGIGTERSFDALISLTGSRPGNIFTEKSLSQMFISRNPDLAEYARNRLHHHKQPQLPAR